MFSQLKKISSIEILERTKALVSDERRISTEILWHLREIESRRLYAEMGFGSMYEMLVHYFGYSEGSAHRRLSAARLLRDVPEVERSLKTGKLTLTTASLAQGFFQKERKAGKPYSAIQKQELLKILENKSRLETEKELAARSPEQARPERLRPINREQSELRLVISEELLAKLEKLKMLLSHKCPNANFAELIEQLADSELKRIDPENRKTSPGEVRPAPSQTKTTQTRAIPAHLKAKIWRRAGGCCEYKDPKSGRRCTSRYLLQYDHKRPYSLGGKTEEENLRLLCREHNVHAAIQTLGPRVMRRFVKNAS